MTSKSRVDGGFSFTAEHWRLGTTLPGGIISTPTRAQTVFSESHPYRLLGKVDRDIGGSFVNFKIEVSPGAPLLLEHYSSPGVLRERCFTMPMHGGLRAILTNMQNALGGSYPISGLVSDASDAALSDSNLNALGAELVSSAKPTNPTVDLATSLAEFFSEKKFFALPGRAGSVEGEYLNYMFGVAPTIADVQDLRTAIKKKDEIIAQFRRDRGKTVRRSAGLPSVTSQGSTETQTNRNPSWFGPAPSSFCFAPGTLTKTTTVTQSRWFSGAFTYTYPDSGFGKTLAELDRLYGVKPDVGTAWELLPFSWLADYKFSLGAAIGNMASFSDGLVMKYGYVMAETVQNVSYSWTGPLRLGEGDRVPVTVSGSVKITTQQRGKANPFGFGIKPGDLSSRQKSILAALGISLLRDKH